MSCQVVTLRWGDGVVTCLQSSERHRTKGSARQTPRWHNYIGGQTLHALLVFHIRLLCLVSQWPWYELKWHFFLPDAVSATSFQDSTASSVLVAILSFLSNVGKHQAFMFDPDSFFICAHFLRDLTWPRGIQCHPYAKNMSIYLSSPLLLSELQTCRSESLVISSLIALEPGRAQVDILVSPAP